MLGLTRLVAVAKDENEALISLSLTPPPPAVN